MSRGTESTLRGWRTRSVEDLRAATENALATGPFGSSIGSRFFQETGVPVIRGSNLTTDGRTYLREEEFVFISESKAHEFTRSTVGPGDLVFTCWGTINQVGLIAEHSRFKQYVLSNKQMKLTPNPKEADSLFLFYLFSSPPLQREIIDQGIGSSVPGFNLGQLRSMRLRVPELGEQRRIAEALRDADALLTQLDQLIAKKEAVKQGAMQQLLTGQIRLPGFAQAWKHVAVAELGSFSKGQGIRKDDVADAGIPCIRYGEIYTRHHDVIRVFYSFVARDIAATSRRLTTGDIIFAASGETAAEIGKCVAFVGTEEAYVGSDTVVLSPAGHDSRFLSRLLNGPSVASQKARYGQGDAVVHISARNLGRVQVAIPELREQRAIAEVLTDMDDELEALKARRDKTQALKQGMMQELLSGRIRLV